MSTNARAKRPVKKIEPAPTPIGERYELGDVIGRGASGEVHRAHDRLLERDVAVKFLYRHLAAEESTRRRFAHEARLAARLHHPNAVAVFDIGDHDGSPFIVMEHVTGATLADRLRDGPLPTDEVRRIGLQVLDALDAAHRLGIVHRDVKPANILLTRDGTAKLADFGIATSADRTNHTTVGLVLGTLAYLAPERLHGERATPRSDLYSVGVVLYEASTGEKPFRSDTPAELLSELLSADRPPDPRVVRPELDAAFTTTVRRAIRREPRARFASARSMSDALQKAQRPVETAAFPVAPAPARVAPVPKPPREPATEVAPSRAFSLRQFTTSVPARAVPWLVGSAAALLLLFVGIATSGELDRPARPTTEVQVENAPPALQQAIDALEEAVQAR